MLAGIAALALAGALPDQPPVAVRLAEHPSVSVSGGVRNIYRKLDATHRREAVRRGRDLRLL